MLTFSRRTTPTATIIIDGLALLLDDTIQADQFWPASELSLTQFQHTATQSINTPPDTIDQALSAKLPVTHQHKPLREFGFTHQRGISGVLWHTGAQYTLAVKGLPERVLAYCEMTDNEREAAELQIQKLSHDGASVIAVAHATLTHPIASLDELQARQLSFSGLVSLSNTIPGDIRVSLRKARARGLSLRLITGAHTQTAFSVARQLGIATHPNEVYDARQLHVAPATMQMATVFARALPEHKAHILKTLGEMNDTIIVTSKEELQRALTTTPSRR